ILDVCRWRAAKMVVKGKSMTSEEIRLNHALEADGIEVVESDLAEFILQLANEQPSHILAPALHYSRERITALFKRKFETDMPLPQQTAPCPELLSLSATGQSMSFYTSFISPPLADPPFAMPSKALKQREFHLVLIDNGRLKMRDDPVFHEALNCIRCGA